MKELITKRLSFVLKYLTGLILLGWILYRVDRRQMLQTILDISPAALAYLVFFAAVNLTVQFLRWKYLVESHSSHYQAKDLIPSFFAGFAFRLMIPGGHAEITKVFLLPGKKRGKVVAFGIEKFFQTYLKLLLVLIAFPVFYPAYQVFMWPVAGTGAAVYFLLPGLLRLKFMDRFKEKEVRYQRLFLQTLLYSLGIFGTLIIQYYILLNDAHTIGWLHTVLAVTFIWGAGLLPISVSGLGVRENLAVFFLANYNIPAFSAVGIALLIFFINAIIPALIGVFYIYRRRKDLKDAGGVIRDTTQKIYNKGRDHWQKKKPDTHP